MARRHPRLPSIWLISDARNDALLERVLARLPRGSGFIYRHYHLEAKTRRARFAGLSRIARRQGHTVVLSGSVRQARCWRADGAYGPPERLTGGAAMLRLLTAHSFREIGVARRARGDAILLSPVFPTRSHPGARTLGPLRFRLLAARTPAPVIALGGMDAQRAKRLRTGKWAAIDGICAKASRWIPTDS